MEQKPTAVLVAFYNVKALGVRYLENALTKAGYHVTTIFFKQFNSISPDMPTEKELQLLCDRIEQAKPVFVGLSLMSSLYMESIHKVIQALQARNLPPCSRSICWISAFPLFSAWTGRSPWSSWPTPCAREPIGKTIPLCATAGTEKMSSTPSGICWTISRATGSPR